MSTPPAERLCPEACLSPTRGRTSHGAHVDCAPLSSVKVSTYLGPMANAAFERQRRETNSELWWLKLKKMKVTQIGSCLCTPAAVA